MSGEKKNIFSGIKQFINANKLLSYGVIGGVGVASVTGIVLGATLSEKQAGNSGVEGVRFTVNTKYNLVNSNNKLYNLLTKDPDIDNKYNGKLSKGYGLKAIEFKNLVSAFDLDKNEFAIKELEITWIWDREYDQHTEGTYILTGKVPTGKEVILEITVKGEDVTPAKISLNALNIPNARLVDVGYNYVQGSSPAENNGIVGYNQRFYLLLFKKGMDKREMMNQVKPLAFAWDGDHDLTSEVTWTGWEDWFKMPDQWGIPQNSYIFATVHDKNGQISRIGIRPGQVADSVLGDN